MLFFSKPYIVQQFFTQEQAVHCAAGLDCKALTSAFFLQVLQGGTERRTLLVDDM